MDAPSMINLFGIESGCPSYSIYAQGDAERVFGGKHATNGERVQPRA